MTAAETLRAAAAKLRRSAEAADTARPGPWQVGCAASVTSPRPGGYEYVTGYTTSQGTAVAEWIVLAQPAMGTALADWLDDAADGDCEGVINPYAVTLARQVLGESEPCCDMPSAAPCDQDDCPGTRKEAHDGAA